MLCTRGTKIYFVLENKRESVKINEHMPQIYALVLADNKGQAERKSNVTAQ